MRLGTEWNGCVAIVQDGVRHKGLSAKRQKALSGYLSVFPEAEQTTIWYDRLEATCFSDYQYKGGPAGKDYHFLSRATDFETGMWGIRFVDGALFYNDTLRSHQRIVTPELICSAHEALESVRGNRLLLVLGGPSTRSVNWKRIDHDVAWTCNKFYLNTSVAAMHFDLVALAPDVSLFPNWELHDYIADHAPALAFEADRGAPVGAWREINELTEFYREQCLFFHCRYQSVLGLGSRMLVLGLLLGASEIAFVGLDGMTTEGPRHAFERYKHNPQWMSRFGPGLQRRQYVIFWQYALRLAEASGAKLYNLGEKCRHNVSREISSAQFPLPAAVAQLL